MSDDNWLWCKLHMIYDVCQVMFFVIDGIKTNPDTNEADIVVKKKHLNIATHAFSGVASTNTTMMATMPILSILVNNGECNTLVSVPESLFDRDELWKSKLDILRKISR